MTFASKLFPLKRVLLIWIRLHDGTGVVVGVRVGVGVSVLVGVKVFVGVNVWVGVRVGVRVKVGDDVLDGVKVGEGVNVVVGTVATTSGKGVLIARVARNCSTTPSRYEARWIIPGCAPKGELGPLKRPNASITIKLKL